MTIFGNKCEMFIFVCVLASVLSAGTRSVFVGASGMYNHPGGTYPDTVEAAIGTDFNITCFMNPKTFPTKNSSCLHFVIGRTNEELPWENIVMINSTTITYMAVNASEQQTEYRCKCGPDAITETKVYVGSLPRSVTDFSCRSYDFDHMICTFTRPNNPILTTYNVSYYNELPNYIYQPKCNYDDRNLVICNISLSERYQEIYHFIIGASNALVKLPEEHLFQHFDINNFEIMIPAKPGDNMRVESLTVDSIKLSWQMPNWERYRLIGLQWEVLLEPENSTTMVRDGAVRERNEMRLRLNNLQFAYWNYKLMIRVRVKHPSAVWSEQLEYTFRTEACRPQRPPRIDPGSFYIDSTETRITVYWEELLPYEYNGGNFTYIINSVNPDGKTSDLKPWHQERNLAKFYWRKDLYYQFEIRSKNHIGESSESSTLIIHPIHQRNLKEFTPRAIHNVYHGNNGTYTLTWSKPKNLTQLLSFSVFWCYPKRALPNECKESMHFQKVSSNQLNFTTHAQNASEEHILNLAVSANYENFNTGLHWTDCSMDIVNTDLVKMEPELTTTANSIKLQWSVERVCPSILDGFNITYCEVPNNVVIENATCVHDKIISKIAKKYDKKYSIEKLKPFTSYKVSMLMFWRTKKGQPSDAQLVRTLEGAPSPPRQLRVENVTNTTAIIKWLEPTHPNGKIRKYIIMLNNDQIEVNASILTYHLENLESFTAYKVYVLAETIERSETSNDVHFTTAVGIPSPPGIGPNNNVANIIQWSKPLKPSGSIDFYEVQVAQFHKEKLLSRRVSIVTDATSCAFKKLPTCVGAEYKTTVKVRAVNAVLLTDKIKIVYDRPTATDLYEENDDLLCKSTSESGDYHYSNDNTEKYTKFESLYEFYKSDWQTSAIFSCSSSRMGRITTIALSAMAMLLSVVTAVYMARKKYNTMANISCTLPAGLETYFTKERVNGFSVDFVGGAGHVIKETQVAEDEWLQTARMHSFNVRTERHHLLPTLDSDGSYLGGTNHNDNSASEYGLGTSIETTGSSDKDIPNEGDDNDQFEESEILHSLARSSDGESAVHRPADGESNNLVLEGRFPNNNGYIKPSIVQPWQLVTDDAEAAATTSGYIKVQHLSQPFENPNKNPTDFTPTAGGYVMHQDVHNLFAATSAVPKTNATTTADNTPQFKNDGGYTTLENLNKRFASAKPPQPNETSINNVQSGSLTDAVPPGDSNSAKPGAISGYVTQQDLNLFAHAQHQHH